jgi:lipopolysaccharide transport system ATP-binding protein
MSDIAISVQNLSKRYRIGLKERVPDTFVGALTSWLKSPLANYRQLHKLSDFRDDPLDKQGHELGATPDDVLYALRDISFDIKKGEVVGIIGRNGAGKSTLLKILSRITEPTSGRVEVHGRVASLLEVGTGFHPELTGRENIYLNGTILGMRKAEIDRKFDEIVAFSEIEKFLDTPVKRYSSGMYVRLAFAVAAHLEPEILIVDEVLAVGDAAFQKKCLGKMQDVSRNEGRTVLFVSHNIPALQAICRRGLMLGSGRVVVDEDMNVAVRRYLSKGATSAADSGERNYRNKGTLVSVDTVELFINDKSTRSVLSGDSCTFRIKYRILDPAAIGQKLSVSLVLYLDGQRVANLWTNYAQGAGELMRANGYIDCDIERWPFRSSPMRAEIYTHIGPEVQDWIEDCLTFDSQDGDYYGSGVTTHHGQGITFLNHTWSSSPCP